MKFLRAANDTLINAERIERIYQRGPDYVVAEVIGAKRVEEIYAPKDLHELAIALLPVVPAAPGFWRIACLFDDNSADEPGVWREPIVAWRIGDDRAEPVTPEPTCPEENYAILYPDGQVSESENRNWASEAEWRNDKIDRRRRELEERLTAVHLIT
jgi:hypothetical protein